MAEAELTKIIGNSYVIIKSSGSRTQKPTEGQVKKEDYHSVEISEPCSGESPNSHGTEADKIHTESTSIFHSKGVRRTGKKVVRNWGDIQVINQNSNKEENHSIEVKSDKWSTSTESYVVYHSNARRKKIVNNNHNIINEVPFHDISTATKMNEQRLSTNKNPGIVIKSATDSSKVYHRRPIGWVEPITKDQNVIVVETPKERVIENNGRIVKIGESYIQYHSSGKRQPKHVLEMGESEVPKSTNVEVSAHHDQYDQIVGNGDESIPEVHHSRDVSVEKTESVSIYHSRGPRKGGASNSTNISTTMKTRTPDEQKTRFVEQNKVESEFTESTSIYHSGPRAAKNAHAIKKNINNVNHNGHKKVERRSQFKVYKIADESSVKYHSRRANEPAPEIFDPNQLMEQFTKYWIHPELYPGGQLAIILYELIEKNFEKYPEQIISIIMRGLRQSKGIVTDNENNALEHFISLHKFGSLIHKKFSSNPNHEYYRKLYYMLDSMISLCQNDLILWLSSRMEASVKNLLTHDPSTAAYKNALSNINAKINLPIKRELRKQIMMCVDINLCNSFVENAWIKNEKKVQIALKNIELIHNDFPTFYELLQVFSNIMHILDRPALSTQYAPSMRSNFICRILESCLMIKSKFDTNEIHITKEEVIDSIQKYKYEMNVSEEIDPVQLGNIEEDLIPFSIWIIGTI